MGVPRQLEVAGDQDTRRIPPHPAPRAARAGGVPRDLEVPDEVHGVAGDQDGTDFVFTLIGDPVPLFPAAASSLPFFDLQSPPVRPLAVSNRHAAALIAHPDGFMVAKIKDLINSCKEAGDKSSSVHHCCMVDVSLAGITILCLSHDESLVAACSDSEIQFFPLASLMNKDVKLCSKSSFGGVDTIKDFKWLASGSYMILFSSGLLSQGNFGEKALKDVFESCVAVDTSKDGNCIALARQKGLSILCSDFKEILNIPLSARIKVDSICWVLGDTIVIGCIRLNEANEEEYLVQVLRTETNTFSEGPSKAVLYTYHDFLQGIMDDAVAGPYLHFAYLNWWNMLLISNKKFLGRQIALMKLTPKLDGKTVTYLEMLEEKYIGRINLQEKANSNVIAGFGVGNVSLSQNITKRVGKKEVAPEHILLCLTGQGELAIYCLARISDLTDLPKAAATVRRKELSPNVISVVCRRIPTESDTDTSRAEAGKSEATEMNAPKKSSKDDGARTVRSSLLPYSGSVSIKEELLCSSRSAAMKQELSHDGREGRDGARTMRSSLLPYSGSVSIKEELLCSSRSAAMKQELSHDGREGRPISFLFDEEDRLLHDLFSCQADMSYSVGLWEHLDGFKGLVIEEHTPGSFNHDSVYTKDEFKEILRELYVLFKCLHQRGYSLGGNFGLGNFLVYEARMRINVKFVNVPKTSLLKDKPEGEHQDLERLVRMVRWEMFNGKCVPHDVNLWLSLIFEKDIEELLPYHSSLMGIEESGDNFILWYDIFLDLEATNGSAYETICKNLRSYDNWQQILLTKEGNDHLSSTLKLQPYRHEFSGLIRLLRNSRCHDGRYHHQKFALIVRQHYPNLISDLQKELFLVGCFKGKFRVPK